MHTRLITIALASVAAVLTTGCETTGDPSTGGIFWSEQKARGRLDERQNKLETIESRTGRTNRNSAETQRRIDSLQ